MLVQCAWRLPHFPVVCWAESRSHKPALALSEKLDTTTKSRAVVRGREVLLRLFALLIV